ncbi:MAG: molybdopterin-dependent oxidoreductase [Gammaproteobacteria bacterium]|nr:molybdopterin-dependent oxidoreductase [Gammaproteobacteria bacterium]
MSSSTDISHNVGHNAPGWIGKPVLRKEDPALLNGHARFIDDIEPVAQVRHAAMARSPHAHAEITRINTQKAEALPGVIGVLTGKDIAARIRPIPSVVKAPIDYYPIAIDKVRFVGEPVAVVVAHDRYVAEDAMELIDVEYRPLAAVVEPHQAMADDAPILHEKLGSNVPSHRTFRYGDPDGAFAEADHVFELAYRFPKYSSTPIETYGVIAEYQFSPERYTVWSNFQGPFVLHPLMAGALGVPGNRLRLISPQASGGSFGIKQAVFGYIVLLCAASRLLGCPIKWIEDRLEHLMGSSSGAGRTGTVAAAFKQDGELIGLRYQNIANMGAYVRPPEPASVYRMQATSNGCYKVQNIVIENTLVLTNEVPAGLNRGYGGPQFFFSLERIMDIAAHGLGIDPAELRRRNFIDKDAFPYTCPGGSIMDSGDYAAGLDEALRLAGYEELKRRCQQARQAGRLYGIGFACGVEPSGSNMAYVTLAQTAEDRAKSAPKSGANSSAVIAMDPTGNVTLQLCSTPNGQGHATVAAQIVADALGIDPDDVDVVTEIDTLTSSWSIASGNYANRFASAVTSAIAICAAKVADKLKHIAGEMLQCDPQSIVLSNGVATIANHPDRSVPIRRLGAAAHWNPAGMPDGTQPGIYETTVYSPPTLTSADSDDRIPSSVTYGSIFDVVGVEIDRDSGKITVDKYVSVHDVGTMLNPLIVEGQVYGGFAHGIGGAMLEELSYDRDGNFLSGTFADYLCPTALEVPELIIGHISTPSPKNILGAKGLGDGSAMMAPAALANAVSDALDFKDVELPLTPHRVWSMIQGRKPPPSSETVLLGNAKTTSAPATTPQIQGSGEVDVETNVQTVWRALLDPETLTLIIPGCEQIEQSSADKYRARVNIGVAGIRGIYQATLKIHDKLEPKRMRLLGKATGTLGFGEFEASVELTPIDDTHTRLGYRYQASMGGKVAAVGQRMLKTVTRLLVRQFFDGLNRALAPTSKVPRGLFKRLISLLRSLIR